MWEEKKGEQKDILKDGKIHDKGKSFNWKMERYMTKESHSKIGPRDLWD